MRQKRRLLGAILLIALGVAVVGGGVIRWRQVQLDSALLTAVQRDDCVRLELLLRAGANPNASQYLRPTDVRAWLLTLLGVRSTAGQAAIQLSLRTPRRDPRAARILIRYGAKANLVDHEGRSLIDYVIDDYGSDQPDLVNLLLEKGSPLSGRRGQLLDIAVEWNDITLARLALKYGSDPNRNHPLVAATEEGNVDMVRFLLESGADPNSRNRYGNIPLTVACSTSYGSEGPADARASIRTAIVKTLLDHGAAPTSVDATGQSALNYASKNHDLETLDMLSKASNHK
jgi:ankyrin repeat protein